MKSINARIIHMHDVEENWKKIPEFVPKVAECIVYDPDNDYKYPRFKFGDGKTPLVDLPFGSENALDNVIIWEDEIGLIDGGKITS